MTTSNPSRGASWRVALGLLVRIALICAPIAYGILTVGTALGGRRAEERVAGLGGRPIVRPAVTLSARPGETVDALLSRGGLSLSEARLVRDMTRPYGDPARLWAGTTARLHAWPGDAPERIELRVDPDVTLVFEMAGAAWRMSAVDSVAVRIDTVVVGGRVESSLWGARLAGDDGRLSLAEKGALPGHLAEVFAWQLDFFRDVRRGDAFRLALEREVRPDGSRRRVQVIAAEWISGDSRYEAYRFSPWDESGAFFYDAEGTALRGPFLRAPLDLTRITSRFSPSRYHPVLGGYRAHRGIDYGAPAGTIVRATGEGTVSSAGWAQDYGLTVELDHSGGIRTRYAHLSGIAEDIRPGAPVRQGSPIGVVGSSGLATGPHLHYEFLVHGRAVDPAGVDLPVSRPLPPEDVGRFTRHRFAAAALLRRVRWPARATDE